MNKDPQSCDSYRPITVCSIIAKLFDNFAIIERTFVSTFVNFVSTLSVFLFGLVTVASPSVTEFLSCVW